MKHQPSSSSSVTSTGPLTPLSTLSSILTTHSANSHTALLLFRQAHALHRHASERTYLAMEKLRAAQAEVEHATTAQEFAKEELDKAAVQKTEAHDAMVAMSKRVRTLSKGLKNERVRLVGLTQNVHWNGRLGTILKLITDGEDAGRWKVKLDQEWRGRDADGKIIHRSDETISDGSDEHQEGTTTNMVVAKAENLELIDEGDIDLFHHQQQLLPTSRSRSASSKRAGSQLGEEKTNARMMYHSPDRRSRDPSISRRHDPTAAVAVVVTPEQSKSPRKQIIPADYVKSKDGRYHESLPHHDHKSQRRLQPIQSSTTNLAQSSSMNHSSKRPINEEQQQQQQQPPRSNASRNPPRIAGTTPPTKYFSPIRRSPSNDSTRLSSAFSQMLLSPVSFTPVSFYPESSESFERWVRQEEGDNKNLDNTQRQIQQNGRHHHQQKQRRGDKQVLQNNNSTSGDSFWCAGSYFDEVTSLDKDAFPYNEGKKAGIKYYEWDDNASDPKLQQIPSTEETYSPPVANNDDDHGHGLPHIVVLPAPEDEYGDAFAPESSPPYCVGVQNAGYSHVNGVYLLAHPKDEGGNNNEVSDKTAPLYFKDGPPTLLSDNRYYDMCILRINCPDSPDHVIWFLARVDIDPNCLDVKFSDCYYYCRMLRNDDGCGGEREGGCDSPPNNGWHLPKLPPGVDMLSIAKSGSFSTAETASSTGNGGYHHGLGIASRPAMFGSKYSI